MYANRAQSGTTPVDCNSSSSSVYFDSGNLGISTYTNLGRYIVYQAYTTFSVPPFPYRICIRDQPAFGTSQYYPIEGVGVTPVVYNYTEIGLNFRASTVMQEGDFAAIAITKIGSTFPYAFTVPDATGLNGDSVKLVPAGYPCTMEGTLSRETAQTSDYCGSNRLTANGFWTSTGCLLAGSVANGVARMGTNAVNPFIDPVMTGFPRTLQAGESLTAYLQLPAYGLYDVCYSPLAYRLAQVNVGSSIGQPLWFKIMSYTSSCTSTSCPSRTRLQVTARIGTVTWSSTSAMIAGSYGSIRIRGAGDLNTNPATKWDPKCSGCTKEFYNTTGGDTFRLVNFASFQINPSFTSGTKVTITGTSTTFGSSTEGTVIDAGATANVGSIAPNAGCWVSDNDNYGTVETPMGMAACASCETGSAGQTASGDLGGDPRSGETTWRQNLANQLLTFSRVRVPSIGGTWRVCYRKAGINNWQYLDWDTLITKPYQGFFQGSATNLISIRESQMNTNFTYTLNDTRKGTWAQFQVASTLANMETTASNFFTTTVPQASVRGAMLKVIDVTQRCDDISQTAATALDGGLAECLPSQCGYVNGSCYGCSGSSDNTATLRRMITFNVLLPSNISSVRVCFRNRVENWRILTPRWNKRYEMPLTAAPDIQYYVNDTRTGSWGRFVFYHLGGGVIDTNTFTATRGSMFRLVPTSVRCDLIWTTSNTAQDYNNRSVDSRLGVVCRTTGTSPCLTTDIAPTSGGVVGSTPYLGLNPRTPDPGSYVPYAAGFALIPAAGATYRVCFREAKKNWIELSPQFTPQAAPLFSVSNLQASYTAGSYVKFTVAATNASINASAAIFKVVDGALNCEFPSVGTYGTTGLIYSSFSIATADGSRTISNGASSSGLYSAVDFYLTLPTATSTPTATTTNLRRICFMPETSASSNWVDLGRIGVVSYSIGYTVNEVPTNGKQFNLTIKAGSGSSLTTGYSGDAVKIVPVNSPWRRCCQDCPRQ
ncbi:Hypothetical protein, putative [Bodo saltans]|uniref:Uncharacterized protein n=1 Tax=Bodo saltans TaxID=75058 RepID=A0A0S4IXM3_BODSA|nr:Hypothetical protein, putative [Bodo saltans]|eukprot:CUG06505.1 Hypothetical protein, putative [Bodo saltans]